MIQIISTSCMRDCIFGFIFKSGLKNMVSPKPKYCRTSANRKSTLKYFSSKLI